MTGFRFAPVLVALLLAGLFGLGLAGPSWAQQDKISAPLDTEVWRNCFLVGNTRQQVARFLLDPPPALPFAQAFGAWIPTLAGRPYGSGGKGSREGQTVVNLHQMDCLTFVEYLLALGLARADLARQPQQWPDADSRFLRFVHHLNRLRYRGGAFTRWEDRYYYFTEALAALHQAGLMANVAQKAGMPARSLRYNFLSKHPERYPGIADWAHIRQQEQRLNRLELAWFPLDSLMTYVNQYAQSGDVAAWATRIPGLDIQHTGLVEVRANGVFFLHASSRSNALLTNQTLLEALSNRPKVVGLYVFRPRF